MWVKAASDETYIGLKVGEEETRTVMKRTLGMDTSSSAEAAAPGPRAISLNDKIALIQEGSHIRQQETRTVHVPARPNLNHRPSSPPPHRHPIRCSR